MGKIKLKTILLFLVILLAAFLRFYKLGEVPAGINRDVASSGYNAYSILKIGQDEYGKKFPLYFKSFGDWKMPVYIYSTVPAVAIFGLNEFAVRLPSAIFGLLTVGVIYFLTKEIFKENKSAIGLIASFLLAISPWHIDYSRQAYEPTLVVFWLTLGALALIKKNKILMFLVFPCLILSLFTYHTTILLALIVFIYLLAIRPLNLITKKQKIIFVLLIFLILLLSQLLEKQAVKDKFIKQTLFYDQSLILEKVILIRDIHKNNDKLVQLFHNRIIEGIITTGENYFKSLSADFLFFGNDPYPRFSINKKSLRLNPLVLIPFLILGSFKIIKKHEVKTLSLIVWLLAAPILPSVVTRSPSSYRLLPMAVPIVIISAYGLGCFLNLFKNIKLKKILVLALVVFLTLDLIKLGEEYIFHRDGGLEYQYKKIIDYYNFISQQRQKKPNLVASRPEESPYIFLAFYQKIDPQWFLANIKRYPVDELGFEHVSQLGEKYQFRSIDWESELKKDTVYIGLFHEVPGDTRNAHINSLVIKNKIGEPLFFELIN